MAKVHISLVGGQPTPVYQGILLTKPEQIILVCSDKTKEMAERIQEKLKELHFFYVLIEQLPIEDSIAIKERISSILKHDVKDDDELSMNLSGGVKIWSLFFLEVCVRADANVFCLSQNGNVLNIRGVAMDAKVNFDMDAQFVLLGNPLKKFNKFSDYDEQDKKNAETIKRLYGNSTFQKLLQMMKDDILHKHTRNIESYCRQDEVVELEDDPENKYIDWNANDKVFAISLSKIVYEEVKGERAAAMLLNTAWFEYQVAAMMADIYGGENVYTNCHFLDTNNLDKNEVDIIVNTGQKLLFIECKTEIAKSTDIDKFASVVRNYGGNGSKALFVTIGQLKKSQAEKCKDNHIDAIHLQNNIKQDGKTVIAQMSIAELKMRLQEILAEVNV